MAAVLSVIQYVNANLLTAKSDTLLCFCCHQTNHDNDQFLHEVYLLEMPSLKDKASDVGVANN